MVYERDTLLKDLQENVCEVFFKKVNGDMRTMRCSLKPEMLPDSYVLTEESKVKDFHLTNPAVIAVWDIQNNGWRSFRIDSVEYVQVLDNY